MKSPIVKLFYDFVYKGLEKFGRYYSDYPGYIHDNKDPLNLSRVRLIIPGIADNPMEDWAWPKNTFAGPGFGLRCIPPEGTMVWVSFRLGEPNKPLWSQGHFGQDDAKDWTDKQKRINNFWFRTPQGNMVELDDEDGTITITDAHGTIVKTSDKGVSIAPIKGKQIFLGSIDKADEGTAMGETTEKITTKHHNSLLSLTSSVMSMGGQLSDFMGKLAAATTPIGAAGVLITEAPKMVDNIKGLTKNTKSINKSLNAVTGDLKKIPSKKVKLDR